MFHADKGYTVDLHDDTRVGALMKGWLSREVRGILFGGLSGLYIFLLNTNLPPYWYELDPAIHQSHSSVNRYNDDTTRPSFLPLDPLQCLGVLAWDSGRAAKPPLRLIEPQDLYAHNSRAL